MTVNRSTAKRFLIALASASMLVGVMLTWVDAAQAAIPAPDNNWQYDDPTCEWLHVEYPANLPNPQNANHVNIRISSGPASITLNWHTSFTWAPASTFVYADHMDWPGWEQYTVEWVQVAETNYHWQGALECGTPPEPPKELLAGIGLASECDAGVLVDVENWGDVAFVWVIDINGEYYDSEVLQPGHTVTTIVMHDDLSLEDMVSVNVYEVEGDESLLDADILYAGDCPLPPPPPPVFECEDGTIVEDIDDCPPPVTVPPETTVPETTVPETTVPETTVPETTVPETTVPPTTVPPTTVPEPPATTVPEPVEELPKTGAKRDLLIVSMWLVAAGLLLYGTSRHRRTEK